MSSANVLPQYGWKDTESDYLAHYLEPVVTKLLKEIAPKRVLDLGCGNGKLCSILHERDGYSVVGVEPDKEGVRIAREAYPEIPFYELGVGDDPKEILEKETELFDVIVSTEVIEHLYSPQHLPQFASQLLKPGGKIIITTPYHGYLKNLVLAITGKLEAHMDPLWEGGHIKFWSKRNLTQLMEENGFRFVSFHGVGRCSYLWMSMVVLFEKR